MSEPSLVAAHAVTVSLGAAPVVRDASVRIERGELVSFVGPNGAGKSSLLAALAGDLAPDRGSVEVQGRPLATWKALELARARAVMPQRVTVAFPFPVIDVVRMGRAPWAGTPLEEDDDEAVAEAIDAADLHGLTDRPVTALSGGELARAALARVLAQRTELLLLDEPTASLDLHHQEAVFQFLRRRAAGGAGVGVVVHDLSLAAAYSDRVLVLADGAVQVDGPPREVLTPELLGPVFHHPVRILHDAATGDVLIGPDRSVVPAAPPSPTHPGGTP